ncbi:unnamed protein product, partial [Porites evermanni]
QAITGRTNESQITTHAISHGHVKGNYVGTFHQFYVRTQYYSKDKSQIRAQITNKTVVIERFFAIFCSSAFFILRNITLSNYQCANNNDDVPCVVFKSEYVKSTSSR